MSSIPLFIGSKWGRVGEWVGGREAGALGESGKGGSLKKMDGMLYDDALQRRFSESFGLTSKPLKWVQVLTVGWVTHPIACLRIYTQVPIGPTHIPEWVASRSPVSGPRPSFFGPAPVVGLSDSCGYSTHEVGK